LAILNMPVTENSCYYFFRKHLFKRFYFIPTNSGTLT
jgi:hypothetical protein